MSKKSISLFAQEVLKIIPLIHKKMLTRRIDIFVKMGKITLPQYFSLRLIDLHAPLKMKDVASVLNITLPAATGHVNRLFKMDLVKRVYDKNDRRIIRIALTSKAKNILNEMDSTFKSGIEDVFGKLTEKERTDYLTILKKIMKILYPKNDEK